MIAFQQAMRAVIPAAEKIDMLWNKRPADENWNAVARGLYEGFVLDAWRNSDEQKINYKFSAWSGYAYPYKLDDQASWGYACVAASWNGDIYPFVEFDTVTEPFDTCILAQFEDTKFKTLISAPFKECKFSFVMGRYKNSSHDTLHYSR